jgi:GTP:adenosylcobinamide-phosphate guanylyltransferase
MSSTAKLDAILPAGGRIDAQLAAKAGTDVKALIEINGKPLVETVIAAVAPNVRRTVLIAGEPIRQRCGGLVSGTIGEADSGPENMFNGLGFLMSQPDPPERVLLATTDLAFVTPEAVNRFIAMAPSDRDIVVPLVRRSEFETAYPGSSSTFVRLRDGSFTLGGMFLLNAATMQRLRPQIDAVFSQRKSKLGMAKLLGPGFIFRFLLKTLTLADVEAKIVALLGCTGSALPGAPVEFAYDIDDLEDYDHALTQVVEA